MEKINNLTLETAKKLVYSKEIKNKVIDFKDKTIYSPDDFFNKEGPESLDWWLLADIRKRDSKTVDFRYLKEEAYCKFPLHFDGLMYILMEELTKKELFSKNQIHIQDYHITDEDNISPKGITVYYPESFDEKIGGINVPHSAIYYPRKLADAISYAKYFNKNVSVSRLIYK